MFLVAQFFIIANSIEWVEKLTLVHDGSMFIAYEFVDRLNFHLHTTISGIYNHLVQIQSITGLCILMKIHPGKL
jgi:hypothetical protein